MFLVCDYALCFDGRGFFLMKSRLATRQKPPLEKLTQRAIIEFLNAKKWLVIKHNNVGIKKPDGSYIPVSTLGVSDLFIISPRGRAICVEVKRDGEKLSDNQRAFLDRVNKTGGIGFVAYSVDDVMWFVEQYEKYGVPTVGEDMRLLGRPPSLENTRLHQGRPPRAPR